MVKTKDITNILMEEIFCIYFAEKSTKKKFTQKRSKCLGVHASEKIIIP